MGRAKDTVMRLVETMDRHDPDALPPLYAPGARISRPGAPELNPQTLRDFFGGFVQAMPDFRHEVIEIVEEGSRVAYHCVVHASFTGVLPTPDGPLSGTGARVRFPHGAFLTIDEQGRIVEDHDFGDMADFMAQLGLVRSAH
jgi:predicted ester cyclase